MDFTQQLIAYYKGERFEAILLTALGGLLLLIAIAMWHNLSHNQMLKGFFYPIAFLAVFTLFAGGFNVYSNNQRIIQLPIKYSANQKELVQTELDRFEGTNGVNKWWMPLKVTWALLVITGMFLSFVTRKDFVNGIAIGLIFFGALGFIIDGFAHQRAKIYTSTLNKHI